MRSVTELITTITPFVLLAAISPIVFLNASTAVSTRGQRGGWQFAAGNLIVLVLLGSASVGALGTAATGFADREIASKTVDRFLGLGLIGYGIYLGWAHYVAHYRPAPGFDQTASGSSAAVGGMVGWGAIGMLTNFTTLPLFVSVSQHIGAAGIGWTSRIVILTVAVACVATPSWLPVVIARFAPARADVSASARASIARWTSAASIIACLVGGGFLLWASA
ncbi:MAG: hypothetical protein M0Z51_02650 [Propionibacterium sp.]|nr:hypothetical protein [Propionibacterium sp.]